MGYCSIVRCVYEVEGKRLVDVPNIILQDSFRMYVYGYDMNYTKYSDAFDIMPRSRPEDYVYTDEELKVWDELEQRIIELENAEVDLSNYYTKAETDGIIAANENKFNPVLYDIPVLYLNGNISGMSKDNAVELDYTYKDKKGKCSVKWQGTSSLEHPKKNYTIKFDNAFEAYAGWGEQKKYCMKANYIDYSHARNVCSAKLWGQIVKSRNKKSMYSTIYPGNSVDGGDYNNFYKYKDGIYTAPFGVSSGGKGRYCINGFTVQGGRLYNVIFDAFMPAGATDKTVRASLFSSTSNAHYALQVAENETWEQLGIVVDATNLIGECYLSIQAQNAENFKFRNVRLLDKTTNEIIPLPPPLQALPCGGAIDGFPVVIMMNDVFNGLYTFNIPKDGWMMGMGYTYGDKEAIICAEGKETGLMKGAAIVGGDGADFELEYVSDENNADWVQESFNNLINALNASDGTDLDTTVAKYLDWDSAIDLLAFIQLIGGFDLKQKNYLMYTYDGIKWYMGAYDMDSTYGNWWTGKYIMSPADGWNARLSNLTEHKIYDLIIKYKKEAFVARYEELRAGVMSEANVGKVFDDFAATIPSVVRDEDARKWTRIPNTLGNNIHQVKDWYRLHCQVIDADIKAL